MFDTVHETLNHDVTHIGGHVTPNGPALRRHSPSFMPVRPGSNAPNQEPVYRKVAVVENFFDIIYTVHVELEGRPGKHAGQKRTYRTITETYAFLPREAVTRFLTGCAECARRPRSASPPPLPTPSPSPTRHPTYLPFLPHCAPDYTRNWESEIDAAHSNYYEPKFEYTELQPLKKVESPKPTDVEEPEPTYIELTSKKVNGFESTPLLNRTSPVEPAFQEEEPVRTDPEIDKDENSLIDVEDVISDSPAPLRLQKDDDAKHSEGESTKAAESRGVDDKTEPKKEKKYNPLDVANLTSKDPPKSRSPPRKKLLPNVEYASNSFGRFPKPWRPDGGAYYGGEEMDYNVPITTAYLKHMRTMSYQDRRDSESKLKYPTLGLHRNPRNSSHSNTKYETTPKPDIIILSKQRGMPTDHRHFGPGCTHIKAYGYGNMHFKKQNGKEIDLEKSPDC
ncbi:unnamed protein product [Spodoptera littoralis]|uniref:Nucleolar protein 4 n=1 Tax=Spodoptera littoralis TaxID=7109 RepID=A0A9P0N0Z3_SPOLI|nr:unnamed protein product [Spodoptera littoralis]CAH1640616.1 unnamed protein product [Spodoptera littoralis]